MPEGDTLFQAAVRLHAALAGQVITRFATPVPALKEQGLVGQRVERVRSQGKYVIVEFGDGRALLTHLRMQGKWSVLRKADLRASARSSRDPRWDDDRTTLILETAEIRAILERAAVAELAPLREIERQLASLGPDMMAPEFDAVAAREALKTHATQTIAEALMVQSLVAGIGNVYKSELLFLEKQNPFQPVSALDDAALDRLLRRARELMLRNRKGPRRTTFGTFASTPYYVYERSGQHCIKCDSKIRMRRQGPLQRSTYYCPECQTVPDEPPAR
ncbi:MAG TPA: DNA-formamidopyrimidine glycosylase family protein [Polyangiaceae bacterium]|nr:DNA-formamidopyrimidine glycosylase family protein [Polyangiaceae bacterium]